MNVTSVVRSDARGLDGNRIKLMLFTIPLHCLCKEVQKLLCGLASCYTETGQIACTMDIQYYNAHAAVLEIRTGQLPMLFKNRCGHCLHQPRLWILTCTIENMNQDQPCERVRDFRNISLVEMFRLPSNLSQFFLIITVLVRIDQ